MIVYCIPGLAADARVFKNIALPSFCTLQPLDWIPVKKEESLAHYARRLANQIDSTKPFALLGLSLGGMLATELALILKPVCTILISSIPVSQHLPPYYRFLGRLRLHKIIPISLLQKASFLKRIFTTETTEEKELVKDMIRKSEPQMIRWGMEAIISWKQEKRLNTVVHIHGTADFILPVRYTKPTHLIRGGGHLMVFNRAAAINKILAAVLLPYERI